MLYARAWSAEEGFATVPGVIVMPLIHGCHAVVVISGCVDIDCATLSPCSALPTTE